jgi:hypothetical protein
MQLDKLSWPALNRVLCLDFVRIIGAHLAKLLEYLWLVFRGNPDAGVADRYLHCAVGLLGIDPDSSSLWRKFDRIGKEIEKYLLDFPLIADVLTKAVVDINVKRDAVLCGPLPHKGASVLYSQGEVKLTQLKLHAAGFNLGKIQDLINKREQMATRR